MLATIPAIASPPSARSRKVIMAGTLRIADLRHEWHDRHVPTINCQGVRMLKKVVCLVLPGTAPFEFGVVCEVFGIDRSAMGGPSFDYHVATADPGPIATSLGFTMDIRDDLTIAADADLIAVPAHLHGTETVDERYLEVIRAAV